MRQDIVEDGQRLAGVGVKAVETKVNGETSDNDSIDKEKKDKKRGGRGKAIMKGKGKENTEMEVEWDYDLELSNSTKRGRRASDASESVEATNEEHIRFGKPLMVQSLDIVSRLNEIACRT